MKNFNIDALISFIPNNFSEKVKINYIFKAP